MEETKTAVVTGGTSGLGAAAALALAARGWRVLVVGRDASRGAEVVARTGGAARFVAGDLFSREGLVRLAAELRRLAPRLDLLVNNAGAMFTKTERTRDGIERTVALNLVAPFVLTEALLPALEAAHGRVINLVTGIPQKAKVSLAQLADEARAGVGGYSRAKLALVALTRQQQARHAARGVTCVSLHPGIIPGTGFGQDLPGWMRRMGGFIARLFGLASTLEQAADRYVQLAEGPLEGGAFYAQGRLAPPPRHAADDAFGAALWQHLSSLYPTTTTSTQPVMAVAP
jgi:NAD(P)-dependent dehydrogenase (short-subunit alcohol dehydrogenase family)